MLVGAAIVLGLVNPQLALHRRAVAMPPIAVLTWLFAHRVFPISREVQRAQGAPDRGIRRGGRRDRDGAGVRPRGRRSRPLRPTARRRSATRRCARRRSRRASCPACSSSRPSGSPRCCSSAAARRSTARSRSASSRCSSRSCCSSSGRSRRSAGSSTSASARPRRRRRSFAWLDGIASLPERDDAGRAAGRAARRSRFEDVHFRYPTGSEVLSGIDLDVRPGRDRRRLRRDRRRARPRS